MNVYLLLAVVILLFFLFVVHRFRCLKFFSDRDIPWHSSADILFGNLIQAHGKADFSKFIRENSQKFGKFWGYFEGPTPVLVVNDVEMLQQIFSKQFNSFHPRKPWPIHGEVDDEEEHVFIASGHRWKRIRTILNPNFSALKLKETMPLIDIHCVELVDEIDQLAFSGSSPSTTDVVFPFQQFTLRTIADVAFGIHGERATPERMRNFLQKLRRFFQLVNTFPLLFVFATLFPEFHRLWKFLFENLPNETRIVNHWIVEKMGEVVEERLKSGERRPDLLQLMLDAELGADEMKDLKLDNSFGELRKRLTRKEITWNSYFFLLAGYETTSSTLAFCAYLLATHPDIQERLHAEIVEKLPPNSNIDYESLNSIRYLDMVINETLRLYPIGAPIVNRLCVEDTEVCGLHIPAGLAIQADSWTVHNNPTIWGEDADEFNPDRFQSELHRERLSSAFLAFGNGPRLCLGQRFALIEAKMAIVHLMWRYRLSTCKKTEIPVPTITKATVMPKTAIVLSVEHRGK